MKIRILILLITGILVATGDCEARKRRTTRSSVGVRSLQLPDAPPALDTIVMPDTAMVRLYGYDKPLRSSRETVFITNLTDRDINSLSLTTRYIDSKGRQFHQTTRRVDADIPAGCTRKVDYPSWDRQQSFYYVGSKRSRSAGVPYRVEVSVDTVFAVPVAGAEM